MNIKLSDHFNYRRLLRFTLPSIVMMIFTSVYSIVDGLFVSNIVGKTSFSALNFVMPAIMIIGAVGFMFGVGGSAIVAKTLGEGKHEKACRLFSMLVVTVAILGVVLGAAGIVLVRPLCELLGAEGAMLEEGVLYARILFAAIPFYMLQFEFQSFFIAAEKPQTGLLVTVVSGLSNMLLDWLLMAVFRWGIAGAAIATGMSQIIGVAISVVFFAGSGSGMLRFARPILDWRALGKACTNGSSEFVSNISMSVVGMLYNIRLMEYAGEDGVAAYGVLMYISMIFFAVFIGYANGVAPVVSFHYGARNDAELKNLLRRSLVLIGIFSVLMFAAGEILARPLSKIFVGYDAELMAMSVHALKIYSISFLLSGTAVLGSAFFTALNDGLTSALISFLRTMVFQVAAVLIFPLLWGLDGIWFSVAAAEVPAVLLVVIFLIVKRKKYNY